MTTRQKLERLRATTPSTTSPRSADGAPDPLYRLEREMLGESADRETPLSLKERLERLIAVRTRPRATPAPAPSVGGPSLDEILTGCAVENERGRFYSVERDLPLEHWHGRVSLSRLKTVSKEALSVLARGGDGALELDLTRTVFLDTETTGLAGGTGTCPFLIGLAYVEEDRFRVRQFFMRDFPEEPALLTELAGVLPRFESLVTFNGKAFDVPLLEARFVLARLRFPLSEAPHFDVLHPSRSLWKARLESCRLADLELALLGFTREEDLPGELIPSLYFRYLRSGDAASLHPVFTHNRNDLLSLAALTVYALELLEEGAVPDHPVDDYSLGRTFERVELSERSIRHYQRALAGGVSGAVRRKSLRQIALHHKRRLEWDRATGLWEELSQEAGPEAVEALRELAMYREHHCRDFRGALAWCERALERVERDARLPLGFRQKWSRELEARRRRLVRRQRGRTAGLGDFDDLNGIMRGR